MTGPRRLVQLDFRRSDAARFGGWPQLRRSAGPNRSRFVGEPGAHQREIFLAQDFAVQKV